MKSMLQDLLGKPSEKQPPISMDAWLKALASVSRHLSHLSPAMNFDSFVRHTTDAICQGLAPLQPIAAHFHIDVSISHLWMPDPTFRLDVYFRMQNRILMPSQTRPVETSREDLFRTHVIVPFEMHKHAIEIMVYHKEDPSTFQRTVIAPILDAFSIAVTQALLIREEHLMLREKWGKESEKIFGGRLGPAIYQVQSPFLFAQSLRGFSMPSSLDASEHIFLNQNEPLGLCRFIFVKLKPYDTATSTSRCIAFFAGLAAQLRYFEHTAAMTSFNDHLQYFSQCINSLSHLGTTDDRISFVVGELSQKTGVVRWHSAGLPPPILFGKNPEVILPPVQAEQAAFQFSTTYDWSSHNQLTLPAGSGLFFITENVIRRLHEINTSPAAFFDRIRHSTHAANIIIEAEKLLSKPDSLKVVSASVTDWNELPFDISMLAAFHSGTHDENR